MGAKSHQSDNISFAEFSISAAPLIVTLTFLISTIFLWSKARYNAIYILFGLYTFLTIFALVTTIGLIL